MVLKEQIIENINNGEILEQLYRQNKKEFTKEFLSIADNYDTELVKFWKIRLEKHNTNQKETDNKDILFIIFISIITFLLVKLQSFFPNIIDSSFYERYIGVIILNSLIVFSFWYNKIKDSKKILSYIGILILILIYVSVVPLNGTIYGGDSVKLALIHVPLLLWCIWGIIFINFDIKNNIKRMEFIRFNGELIILTGLILILGFILCLITIALFQAINIDILFIITNFIAVLGIVAAPIVANYLISQKPDVIKKVVPALAELFTPLVLVMLIAYFIALLTSFKNIFDDRDLLMLMNIVLVLVVAIIIFAISEIKKSDKKNFNLIMLLSMSTLSIIINVIALIAIIIRLQDGFTPNRTIVLGTNILLLGNLVIIVKDLIKSYKNSDNLQKTENNISKYFNVYFLWFSLVVFILPLIFYYQ
ncbi:MAG TPA: hypothetical protein PKH87_05555 [Bacteroidales bacterium]|nr:hypothetical protein [Bacteroidales bacterium]